MIRPAHLLDLPAIVELLADDTRGRSRERPDQVDDAYLPAFAEIAANPHSLVAVAEGEDGAILGCIQLSFLRSLSHRGARRCEIEDVRVASGHRRQGVGRSLIAWAVEEARRRECRMVQLFMHREREPARRFYAAMGFGQEHDGWRMVLD
jgi:GNAT superfamily N-acetyltransferase